MRTSSMGMTLEARDTVTLWASRSEDWACLVIDGETTSCEIRMDRAHVTALRDQLPAVLAGQDRWVAEDAACANADLAERRAVSTTTRALDLVAEAAAKGVPELVASLRAGATDAGAKATAVDVALRAFENATAEADHATEKLIRLTSEVDVALRRSASSGPHTGACAVGT